MTQKKHAAHPRGNAPNCMAERKWRLAHVIEEMESLKHAGVPVFESSSGRSHCGRQQPHTNVCLHEGVCSGVCHVISAQTMRCQRRLLARFFFVVSLMFERFPREAETCAPRSERAHPPHNRKPLLPTSPQTETEPNKKHSTERSVPNTGR